MATINNESDSSQKNMSNEESDNKGDQDNIYECNICLDNATDAVVSVCGHLFWLVLLLNENYIDMYICLFICICMLPIYLNILFSLFVVEIIQLKSRIINYLGVNFHIKNINVIFVKIY